MSPDNPNPIVRARGVVVRYGTTTAVDAIDLDVTRGGITVLVGASGCGKTSLLRAIAGFERPSSGAIEIDGTPVVGSDVCLPPERRRVGMVFQDGALFPHLTVRQNVAFGVTTTPREAHVDAALELVGLAALGARYPDQLSGGQRQRVAIARALAPGPRLVLLDEPFANLDAGLRGELRAEVREILRRAEASAVLVTHEQEEALSLADTLVVMADGRILQCGTPRAVYETPRCSAVARFIGGGIEIAATASDGRLRTPFGELRADVPDGEVRLLVRPEQLRLAPAGARGRVVRRHYLGYAHLDEVALDDGATVRLRGRGGARPGETVHVAVDADRLPVFPLPPTAPCLGWAVTDEAVPGHPTR